ncbi:MAG: tetratricopeptide repeat protein [Alphaproteobacteria bacterium]|nr:tetratricopeptide repeat protein [Alphaproteobacteria bacterium]
MPFACLCDGADTADVIYCCEALVAWAEARYDAAWMAAERALSADPGHSPSWLLYAYARYKRGHRAEAMQILEGLASDPDVGKRARRALTLNHHRHDRNQVHVSMGIEGGLGAAPLLVVDVPLTRRIGVRMDARYASWFANDLFGPGGALGLTWNATAGVWRFQLAGSVNGFVDDQPSRMRAGASSGMRVDVRLFQGVGLGTEVGLGVQDGENGAWGYPYGRAFLTVFAPARRYY